MRRDSRASSFNIPQACQRNYPTELPLCAVPPRLNLCRIGAAGTLLPMAELLAASSLLALVALTALEIVLGVDNLVFIAILTGRLPPEKRPMARKIGLSMAAIGRIL